MTEVISVRAGLDCSSALYDVSIYNNIEVTDSQKMRDSLRLNSAGFRWFRSVHCIASDSYVFVAYLRDSGC